MSESIQKKKKETTTRAGRAKKEKKPVHVVAVVTPDGIEGTFTPEPRKPLIVHLPFNSSEVEFNDTSIRYDPNPPQQPEPYSTETNNYFQVNSDEATEENQIGVEQVGWKMNLEKQVNEKEVEVPKTVESVVPVPHAVTTPIPSGPHKLMNCYFTKNGESFIPPEKTDICCLWCTNSFDERPCFIPVKEESNIYHVYGNFCCVECAFSFVLKESIDTHVRWERVALLHRMYKITSKLYPSPPRESLAKFGGIYSYEQYKSIIQEKKIRVDISVPPMVSILGTLDTKPIDFYEANIQTSFANSFSLDRFRLWSEQGGALRLKRSKPLKDKESTLDSCIQLSVKRANETSLEF